VNTGNALDIGARASRRRPGLSRASGKSEFAVRFLSDLRDDHAKYSKILSLLSREVTRLGDAPRRSLPLLRESFQFITRYLDDYHHPREDILFEQLARRSRSRMKLLAALRHEHRRGTLMSRRIASEIHEVLHSRRDGRLERLGRDVDRFVDQSRSHIGREERLMYSGASRTLTEKDWRTIESAAPTPDPVLALDGLRGQYPLLTRYFESSHPRYVPGESRGLTDRLRLDKAGATYGHWVGRLVQTLMISHRHRAEAVNLTVRTVRTICTPRLPGDYAVAVYDQCGHDLREIRRWTQEWREHFGCSSGKRAKPAI
jgi:hemerythrin-like domain-containing protein